MQVPEDAVDQGAVVLPGVAGLAVVVAIREEGRDPVPLGVGKIEAVHGWPPSGNLPSREMGSTFILPENTIVRNDLKPGPAAMLEPPTAWLPVNVLPLTLRVAPASLKMAPPPPSPGTVPLGVVPPLPP